MLYEYGRFGRYGNPVDMEDMMTGFRGNRDLGEWMDSQRQTAIDIMNSMLDEVGMQQLRGLHEH